MEALVGRERELAELQSAIGRASSGDGSVILISGEAGVGKSRLVEEAQAKCKGMGFTICAGNAIKESMQPFLVISRALAPLTKSHLFDTYVSTRFATVFALDNGHGDVLAAAGKGAGETGAYASMLAAVQAFIGDSFRGTSSSLGRIEHHDSKILIERAGRFSVVAVLDGPESSEMRVAARGAAMRISREPGVMQKVLENLAGTLFAARRELEGLKLENERIRIANAVLEVVRESTAERPILLVLEDIHWADESSLFVLRYMARNLAGSNILVVVTARPSEGSKAQGTFSAMREDGSISEIAMGGLGVEAVAGLVASSLRPNILPTSFVERIHEDSGGNPFFISELLRQMVSDGAIAMHEGVYALAREDYEMPSSVSDVVARRLESIDGDAMALAEYASCVGRVFETSVALSAPSLEHPGASMEKLKASGIVRVCGDTGEFTHALFQAAVYDSLAPRWRAAHHRSIGEHLERASAGMPDDTVYELARHFSLSADHAKAYGYCVQAGEKAEAAYASEQAIRFYESAISAAKLSRVLDGAPRPIELVERIGDLGMVSGDYDGASESFLRAMDKSEAEAKARLMRKAGEARGRKGEYDGSLDILDRARELLGREGGERGRIDLAEGYTHWWRGDYDRALSLFGDAMSMFRSVGGMERDLGNALRAVGNIQWSRGEYEQAKSHYEESHKLMSGIGDEEGTAASLHNMGLVSLYFGNLDEALDFFVESREICKKIGVQWGIYLTSDLTGSVLFHKGDLRTAMKFFNEGLTVARKIGDQRGVALSHASIGELSKESGDLDGAASHYGESLSRGRRIGAKDMIVASLIGIGAVSIVRSELRKAGELIEEAERVSRDAGMGEWHAQSLLVRGLLREAEGDESKARADLSNALKEYAGIRMAIGAAKAGYELGRFEAAAGNPAEGKSRMEAALGFFERSGMRLWASRCERGLAALEKGGRLNNGI
jgi:tetratricopeptide (TPR) repeat protein